MKQNHFHAARLFQCLLAVGLVSAALWTRPTQANEALPVAGLLLNPYRFGVAAAPDVAFVSAANGVLSSGTSFTITVPTVSTGDALVVLAWDNAGSAGDTMAIADDDSGSYTLHSSVAASAGGWMQLWGRYATSASSAKTITVSSVNATGIAVGILLVFRNVDQTTMLNVLGTGSHTSGTNSRAAVTPTYSGGAFVLAVARRNALGGSFSGETTASQGALTEPANADVQSSVGAGAAMCAAYKLAPALSTTGVVSWTPSANSSSASIVFEMKKA